MTRERIFSRGVQGAVKSALALAVAAALAGASWTASAATIGLIETLQEEQAGVPAGNNPSRNLYQPAAVVVSPDGKFVYVAATGDSAVTVYARDAATGRLTETQVLEGRNVYGLTSVQHIALSPDGKNLYAAGLMPSGPIYQGAVASLVRNPDTGALQLGSLVAQSWLVVPNDGKPDAHLSISDARMAFSPDGAFMYYVCMDVPEVIVFDRAANGALSYNTMYQGAANPDPNAPALLDQISNSHDIVASPDGANVYVVGAGTGNTGGDVVVFSRDAATGALTAVETHANGVAGITGLDAPKAAVISADGKNLYVASAKGNAVVVFDRAVDGKLTYAATVNLVDAATNQNVLAGAQTLSLSADGKFVYVGTASATVAVFTRDTATGLLSALGFVGDGLEGLVLDTVVSTALTADGEHLYAATGKAATDGGKVNGVSVFGTTSDLAVSIQDGVAGVTPGADYGYTVTVANHGPSDAREVGATVTLPAEVAFISATAADPAVSCSENAGVIACMIGKLGAAAESVIAVNVTAPAQELTVTASASVTAGSTDSETANNSDEEQTIVAVVVPPPTDGGGGAPTDGGTAPTDGGTTPTDGGTAPADGGTTPADGGTTPADGGTTPADATDNPPADGNGGSAPSEADPAADSSNDPESVGLGSGGVIDLFALAAGLLLTLRRKLAR